MNKVNLNNEIVNCRPAIRRARVCIIRKKIKKIKILKACKKDDLKEKKQKKAERLTEEIMILKKVREDDVTKFALQHTDLEKILKNTPANDHEHAYASLSLFPDVKKKVDNIKEQIPDCEAALPILLRDLGTRTMLKKYKRINQGLPAKAPKKNEKPKDDVQENSDVEDDAADQKNESISEGSDAEDESVDKEPVKVSINESSEDDTQEIKIPETKTVRKKLRIDKEPKIVKKNKPQVVLEKEENIPTVKERKKQKEEPIREEIKVDDPFFVSKKVSIPKLLLSEMEENPDKELKFSKDEPERWGDRRPQGRFGRDDSDRWGDRRAQGKFNRDEGSRRPQSKFGRSDQEGNFSRDRPSWRSEQPEPRENRFSKPFGRDGPGRSEDDDFEKPKEEKLHPSWEAKKVKLIQPFQGKKIKFDLD